jgi:hypothetical protein
MLFNKHFLIFIFAFLVFGSIALPREEVHLGRAYNGLLQDLDPVPAGFQVTGSLSHSVKMSTNMSILIYRVKISIIYLLPFAHLIPGAIFMLSS